MTFRRGLLVTICAATATSLAASTVVQASGPIVTLDKGKFIGTVISGTNWFWIPMVNLAHNGRSILPRPCN